MVINVNGGLKPQQIEKIKDIGFGHFLSMVIESPLLNLGVWMLWHYDTKKEVFDFGNGKQIPLSPMSISRLSGLPCRGKPIHENTSKYNGISELKGKLGVPTKGSHKISGRTLEAKIRDGAADDLFVTCWTLLLVDKIIAPDTGAYISTRFLEVCQDVNNLMNYDWVGYLTILNVVRMH